MLFFKYECAGFGLRTVVCRSNVQALQQHPLQAEKKMRWVSTGHLGAVSRFLASSRDSGLRLSPRVEDIRQAMLEYLGESGALAFPVLERRITFEADAQGLWYLRGDLLEALAATQGEASARKEIEELTVMFQGLLPPGLSSRPSPLSE
jgi:hypothetical protein